MGYIFSKPNVSTWSWSFTDCKTAHQVRENVHFLRHTSPTRNLSFYFYWARCIPAVMLPSNRFVRTRVKFRFWFSVRALLDWVSRYHEEPMKTRVNTRKRPQAWETRIDFNFGSDWLKRLGELVKPMSKTKTIQDHLLWHSIDNYSKGKDLCLSRVNRQKDPSKMADSP